MTTTNKAFRMAFRAIAEQSGGRCEVRGLRDLKNVIGLGRNATAEEWMLGALALVARWHTRPTLRIGDVVIADYHGAAYIGRIRAFDGSGYVYLAPLSGTFDVRGMARDGLALSPDQCGAMWRIGRKPFAKIAHAPATVLGGCYGVA